MNVSQKIKYNMGCKYIQNMDDRCRYLVNRNKLFLIYDELFSVFDTDYE